ncbi:hypothetical protein [Xanthobacter oligotrophicus]|uniref:hypothetical protein n=1 Tax=Xanthobacter oligotrophicus TaxID=2607286 RepID=UPI0011F16B39|nr:hypothetical protein [Xanthobacter oligotrophicus]MCG5237491.1 hypothetical protein [Xanthobacter oligotrophicus]
MRGVASARKESDLLYLFMVVVFLLFAARDGLTGVVRYFLSLAHLDVLWFVPDLMSFVLVIVFVYQQVFVKKNPIGILFIFSFIFSLGVGVYFMKGDALVLVSSFKSVTPMFVGFCFYNRSITERRWVRCILLVILVASAAGLILNPFIEYPWTGQTITAFGVEKQATKVWWQGGEIRYGGFAGDSTMAAFMVLFLYAVLAPYQSLAINVASWPIFAWAIYTSTSKTAVGILFIYVMMFVAAKFLRHPDLIKTFLRRSALWSFLALLVPPVLMLALSGVNLEDMSPTLMSMTDRINNTWQQPFETVAQLFPVGLVIGCGIGCFAYPMQYTPLAYLHVPLDNFYLTTFIMMGFPFVVVVLYQIYSVRLIRDPIRLSLIVLFNLYSITIQCYGPSFATLMYGYIFSGMFSVAWRRERRIQPALATPSGFGVAASSNGESGVGLKAGRQPAR